jgi:hypothetical protein
VVRALAQRAVGYGYNAVKINQFEGVRAHPRPRWAARVLGSWVRDRKLISINEAIRRASLIPARILEQAVPQKRDKGRIRVGADADINRV